MNHLKQLPGPALGLLATPKVTRASLCLPKVVHARERCTPPSTTTACSVALSAIDPPCLRSILVLFPLKSAWLAAGLCKPPKGQFRPTVPDTSLHHRPCPTPRALHLSASIHGPPQPRHPSIPRCCPSPHFSPSFRLSSFLVFALIVS